MRRYVVHRLLQGIVTIIASTIIVFLLVRVAGDPLQTIMPEDATPEQFEQMATYMGLDRPLYEQYWVFLQNLAQGNLGHSLVFRRPVADMIIERAPATIRLAAAAMLVTLLIGLPAGVIAAVKRGRWYESVTTAFALFGQAVPNFWLGIVLIFVVAVLFRWLPAGGYGEGDLRNMVLPAVTLGTHYAAGILRLTRSSMLDVLDSDYVRLARIKGVAEMSVIWKHALRNALLPVVTFFGVAICGLLAGTIVTETVFAWPGLGRLAYQAASYSDYALLQGLLIVFVGIYIVGNLLVDLSYVYLDPRIRYVKQ